MAVAQSANALLESAFTFDLVSWFNWYKVTLRGEADRGVKVRYYARSRFRRCVAIVMMAAAVAFTFETSFIVSAETATEDDHFHEESSSDPADGAHPKTHLVTHIHTDGTVHRHAVDDDDDLADHLRESGSPCWSMAIVVGVLPSPSVCSVEAILIGKLAIRGPDPYSGADPDVPGRPPSIPSIA